MNSLLYLPRDMLKEIAMVGPGVYFALSLCNKYLNNICDELKDKAKRTFLLKHIQTLKDDSEFNLAIPLPLISISTPLPGSDVCIMPNLVKYYTVNGLKEGILKGYKDNKRIMLLEYVHDIPQGVYKWWYPDSDQLEFETTVVDGEIHGEVKTYKKDGEICWEEVVNGKL